MVVFVGNYDRLMTTRNGMMSPKNLPIFTSDIYGWFI